jgi:hypothetical protein
MAVGTARDRLTKALQSACVLGLPTGRALSNFRRTTDPTKPQRAGRETTSIVIAKIWLIIGACRQPCQFEKIDMIYCLDRNFLFFNRSRSVAASVIIGRLRGKSRDIRKPLALPSDNAAGGIRRLKICAPCCYDDYFTFNLKEPWTIGH